MAKKKTTTHTQAVNISKVTGRFVSAKYAKANPKKTTRRKITITKTV